MELCMFLGFILTLLMFIVVIWERVALIEMTFENLIDVVFIFLLLGTIISFVWWLRSRWMKRIKRIEENLTNSKSECKEAMDVLKNELNEKTEKCNEQYTQIKSELKDKIKEHNDLIARQESNLNKKVRLTDCDIKLHYKEGNPILSITQNLINMSDDKLVLKSLFLFVKADGAEIDKIVYDSENATSDLGKKVFVSDLPPYEDCLVTCETTRLPRINPNHHKEKVRIDVDGEICFYVQSGKVTKKVKGTKDIPIETNLINTY
jgi:F0F1-type ATP synthase membrane subunit b/b'